MAKEIFLTALSLPTMELHNSCILKGAIKQVRYGVQAVDVGPLPNYLQIRMKFVRKYFVTSILVNEKLNMSPKVLVTFSVFHLLSSLSIFYFIFQPLMCTLTRFMDTNKTTAVISQCQR